MRHISINPFRPQRYIPPDEYAVTKTKDIVAMRDSAASCISRLGDSHPLATLWKQAISEADKEIAARASAAV